MASIQQWALLTVSTWLVVLPQPIQSHHDLPQSISSSVQEKKDPSHTGKQDHHRQLEVSTNQPPPKVDLVVHPDREGGWNLELQVTNFEFAPERVNTTSTSTEGHAHLYVNGKKVTRLYGNWYYLSSLQPGSNTLKVTLNSNGHEALVYQGKPVSDTEVVQVPPQP